MPEALAPEAPVSDLVAALLARDAAAGAAQSTSAPSNATPSTSAGASSPGAGDGGGNWSQAPRLWVSPKGAISPLHYDRSHSFLVQLAGRKRMLFWGPDQLDLLYPYPDTHLLRRRSRVNVHRPDLGRFPLLSRAAAREVVLSPGDVVFFPSRWSHYTESLDFSVSLTARLTSSGGGGGARQSGHADASERE